VLRGRSSRVFRTSTFQIAILYLALFVITTLAVLGVVYWSTTGLIERQTNETVRAEIRGLAEQYNTEGLDRLVDVIQQRSGPGGDHQSIYLLTDPLNRPLAGNLEKWPGSKPGQNGWVDIKVDRKDDPSTSGYAARARVFDLDGGFHLLVGRVVEGRDVLQRIALEALTWALVPAILLGLVGGVVIGRYSLRRVDAVRSIGQEIIMGDLSRRVPLNGSGDEFDRLAETINEMLEQINKLMVGMHIVTDSLAHDLRSPLTRAKSGIEYALRRSGDVQADRRALEQVAVELESIQRTFDALISIAQAEAGVNRIALSDLDLSGLVNDIFEIYQPIAEDKGLDLCAKIDDGISCHGHRQLLGQAIANLLDNAVKYTPAGAEVRLSLEVAGDQPVLTVCDTGPGVAAEDRGRILERFVRLDDSRGTPGSGLGLSLVAAVATLHEARLELADNAPGLRVKLTFPAIRSRSDVRGRKTAPSPRPSGKRESVVGQPA
jgi:signal transduction histidine kinase